mmetsp:Transcript_29650/g.57814  ORF Transcript_29650/g.57814 Transcript_29650/m.57814 type:complete len:259 (+) Transcript_29650:874-1650(+)
MDMKQVKEMIGKAVPQGPKPLYMRLRELKGTSLGGLYCDDKTLYKNRPGLQDGDGIIIQKTVIPEVTTSDTLLINLYRWHPKEQTLDGPVEVALSRHLKVPELKEKLHQLSGITAEDIRIVKPMKWQLKDLANMPLLQWHMRNVKAQAILGGKPWRARSGDTLCYKDGKILELIEQNKDNPDKGIVTRRGAPERAIKILTPEEIEAREAALKAAEEKYKEEAAKRSAANDKADGGHGGADGSVPPPPAPELMPPPPAV